MARNIFWSGKKARPKSAVKGKRSTLEQFEIGFMRDMLGTLIAISRGVENVSKLNVPEVVGRRLFQCYDDLRKER